MLTPTGGSEVKASACNAGDLGLTPGSGRSPGEGTGNPLQYSCLENPMVGEDWWATVHGVAKSWTQLSNFTFTVKQLFYVFLFYIDEHYIIFGFHQTDFSLMPAVQFLFHIFEHN